MCAESLVGDEGNGSQSHRISEGNCGLGKPGGWRARGSGLEKMAVMERNPVSGLLGLVGWMLLHVQYDDDGAL